MRIHRVLAEACEVMLRQVFEEGRVLDRVAAAAFKANPKWGKRDRAFIAESVWEVVRWRRALAFVV
ncbi:MAG: RNA methyltransferase, partial [Verrucomicrobiota bacterium]